MELDKEWIKNCLIGLDGIEEVLCIGLKPAVGDNENFGSAVLKLTLNVKLKSSELTERSVILKMQSEAASAYLGSHEEYIFDLETKVFKDILRAMERMMNSEEDVLWPRCYGMKKMLILMEDLTESGFVMIPKEDPLDAQDALFIMREYGRFHALSMILIEEGKVNPDSIKNQFIVMENNVTTRLYQSAMMALADVIEQNWASEWIDFCNEVRSDIQNIGTKLKELAVKTRNTFCVFNHGDCWTNNILFKYNQDRQLQAIRLIDFQEGHFNCFAWDLTYLLYCCMLPSVRQEYMDRLLNSYRESLVKTCSQHDYEGTVPSIEEIHSAMDTMKYYGLVTAVTARPLLMASADIDFNMDLAKLHDLSQPQCIHHPQYYSSETLSIVREEVQLYLDYRNRATH